ncbi:MAG: rod-determining factor RdfA [Halobacteriota archaeon]|uniref:rod-determining factor RdfA n=1 Tax=Natronomonas sp. TaxID=2184060 RepID=UPI003974C22C
MNDADDRPGSGRGRRSKVARLLQEYDMEELGAELERRWTADEDRQSLRELAEFFNRQILERALEDADIRPLDGEVANIYRLLTSDSSGADRTRIRRRLERDGLDVEAVEKDFVTYQAIRTYLKKHRGAEYTPDETDPVEREIKNIQQLRGRVDSVTEGKLDQLRASGHLELGTFRTLVDVRVVCEDCNTQFSAIELLERGHCNCTE